jgi:hypothetical protein
MAFLTSANGKNLRPLCIVGTVLSGLLSLALLAGPALAGPPRIDKIERFQSNQVLIHFDTEADLNYELQYTDNLRMSNGVSVATWTNLYVAPNLPFPNHYIVPDTRTAKQRFYRLRVTP